MIRGTTPTLQFTLPVDTSQMACLYVTIAQEGEVVVEKCLTDCACDKAVVTCKLSQADTLKLKSGVHTEVQVRGRTNSGEALASQVIPVRADRILKDGEI